MIRAELAAAINLVVDDHLLGNRETAIQLGITPAQFHRLRNYTLRKLRTELLIAAAVRIGISLSIYVKPARPDRKITLNARILLPSQSPASPPDRKSALESSPEYKAALRRGRKTAAKILARPEMITAETLARKLRVDVGMIEHMREGGHLIALRRADGSLRFPRWQVDPLGYPYGIIRELNLLFATDTGELSPWSVYLFLVRRHNEIQRKTAISLVRAGRSREVANVAYAILHGAFS
jgi:hypothetical protein